jgi:lipopolysaccharide transport system permease protein
MLSPITSNPHRRHSTSLYTLSLSLWEHRQLIRQMTVREVAGRYRGSIMGLAWSFLQPIFMLCVYSFIFSVVFQSRWSVNPENGKAQFATILFVGMLIHGFFAEVLNRAPMLIFANVNYVKKVVFPLEILPIVLVGAALFHSLISVLILMIAVFIISGAVPLTSFYLPLIVLPLVILTSGIAWALASFGVFLRDIGQSISLLTGVLLFLAPVFYPISALPPEFQPLILANPLTFIIEQARDVLIFGRAPNLLGLLAYLAFALAITWLGYACFQKTRKGFADVL